MDTNLLIQYIMVGLILFGAGVWAVWKIIELRRNKVSKCCGCSLGDTCAKRRMEGQRIREI